MQEIYFRIVSVSCPCQFRGHFSGISVLFACISREEGHPKRAVILPESTAAACLIKPARGPERSLECPQSYAKGCSRHPKPGTDVIKWTIPLKAAGSVDRGSSENRRETAKKGVCQLGCVNGHTVYELDREISQDRRPVFDRGGPFP